MKNTIAKGIRAQQDTIQRNIDAIIKRAQNIIDLQTYASDNESEICAADILWEVRKMSEHGANIKEARCIINALEELIQAQE